LRNKLEVEYGVNTRGPGQTCGDVVEALQQDRRSAFDFDVRALFNYFETVSIGMKNDVLDEEICYEHFVANRHADTGNGDYR
jgi:hypothetical protein